MRTIRSRWSLLTAVVTAVVVVSLILFFIHDAPLHKQNEPHSAHRRRWNLARLSETSEKTPSTTTADPHPTGVSRKVIVVSLARSGSSLTGDIISHGPSVYYVYEPLRQSEINMWADYERRKKQNTTHGMKAVVEWRSNATDMIRSFLSCHFSDLDPNDLDLIYLRKFPRSRRFATCAEEAVRKNSTTVNAACLTNTESMCHKAKVKLIKVIRLGLRDLEPLLKEYPDLVLVLLARDPRASVWSRIQVFKEKKALNQSSFVPARLDMFFLCQSKPQVRVYTLSHPSPTWNHPSPPVTNLEPPVTNLEPPVTNLEPPVTNLEPPVTNLEPPSPTWNDPVMDGLWRRDSSSTIDQPQGVDDFNTVNFRGSVVTVFVSARASNVKGHLVERIDGQRCNTRMRSTIVYRMCKRLDDDISALGELRHRYPGRVRLLRYEALAENPVKVSKLLYRFIGLKWNNYAENLVRRQTSASVSQIKALKENNKTMPYSVWREESVKASRAWKRDVDWRFVKTAQEKCFGVMRQLGYTLFRYEVDLRDNTTQSYDHQQSLLGDDTVWLQ
ncbi:uncharacterized protein [Littorina saxatilis]|uniref:uncharacterized protein n=1 Tax=Littorina saxatilis TaxID=31220 RepID=UPI0038B4532E